MNYSKSTKQKQNKVFKRIMISWCITFAIGFLIGTLTTSICTSNIKSVSAENVSANCKSIESLGNFKTTAYCSCSKCCGKSDGITASGKRAVQGITIAADTNILPMGSKVIIDGLEYTVQDKGAAIKGNKIDIYFESHQDALNYGVQNKEIFIERIDEND